MTSEHSQAPERDEPLSRDEDERALVSGLFATLARHAVVVETGPPQCGREVLLGSEGEVVAGAVEKRLREFATGRQLARRALAQLGFAPQPLVTGPDRAPRWPDGAVGSIAHTDGLCLAVCARRADWRSLGVDIEPDRPLADELQSYVLRPEELERVGAESGADRAALATFCAKEAVYKCQYPLSNQMLEFHDVRVELDATGSFTAEILVAPTGAPWRLVHGKLALTSGHLFAAAALPA